MRLIDADELIKDRVENDPVRIAAQCAPTVGAEPVRYGNWVWNPNAMDWGLGAWQCSECHSSNISLPMNTNLSPYAFMCGQYCPCCGAKMKETR